MMGEDQLITGHLGSNTTERMSCDQGKRVNGQSGQLGVGGGGRKEVAAAAGDNAVPFPGNRLKEKGKSKVPAFIFSLTPLLALMSWINRRPDLR